MKPVLNAKKRRPGTSLAVPKILAVPLLLILVLQLSYSFWGRLFWVNMTESEPRGLYRLQGLTGSISRGDLVLMEIPAPYHGYVYGRHWIPNGWPLIKHVGAVAGDTFCVDDSGFTVNGVRLGPVFRIDQEGLPLPRIEGCQTVPVGSFLPVALGTERSFDGRYLGPVAVSYIRGRLSPVFTLK